MKFSLSWVFEVVFYNYAQNCFFLAQMIIKLGIGKCFFCQYPIKEIKEIKVTKEIKEVFYFVPVLPMPPRLLPSNLSTSSNTSFG